MTDNALLAAADHIRSCNEANALAEQKAPLKRALALVKIETLSGLINKTVHEAHRGEDTTPEFADALTRLADQMEEVYNEAVKL